ncbi:MAG TPA: hypothetical protein VF008_30105, partial [Niastella sp.]
SHNTADKHHLRGEGAGDFLKIFPPLSWPMGQESGGMPTLTQFKLHSQMAIEICQITIEIGLPVIEMKVIVSDIGLILIEITDVIIDVMLISFDIKVAVFNNLK